LKRSISLVAATSIGVGTMVGAGIFVFPGIAGGQAGPSSIISFLLGGGIALLVAACTAELSTAMPKSGGGYFFISRTYNALLGTVVGVSQWLGLVFACAFYLAGFGEYCIELVQRLDLNIPQEIIAFALPATVVILIINIVGGEAVGKFQNTLVISLTLLIIALYFYGFLDVVGVTGKVKTFDSFFPKGKGVVFSTAALIFTSYLGFVQIANVAAEVKNPSVNLPKALMGSVLIVMVLYAFVLFITTRILTTDELTALGESATLEVARRLIGNEGAFVILFSGLLATLSSANASVLSASRSIFALGKDGLIPETVSKINKRFNTPYVAILLVSVPIAALVFVNNLEFFAQVASFLHLVIYAGICLSIFKLRREMPSWYQPTFRVLHGKIIGVVGALCCFTLIVFLDFMSIIVGSGIIVSALLYHIIFKRGTKLQQINDTE